MGWMQDAARWFRGEVIPPPAPPENEKPRNGLEVVLDRANAWIDGPPQRDVSQRIADLHAALSNGDRLDVRDGNAKAEAALMASHDDAELRGELHSRGMTLGDGGDLTGGSYGRMAEAIPLTPLEHLTSLQIAERDRDPAFVEREAVQFKPQIGHVAEVTPWTEIEHDGEVFGEIAHVITVAPAGYYIESFVADEDYGPPEDRPSPQGPFRDIEAAREAARSDAAEWQGAWQGRVERERETLDQERAASKEEHQKAREQEREDEEQEL